MRSEGDTGVTLVDGQVQGAAKGLGQASQQREGGYGAAAFGTVGAIQISAAPGSSGAPLARATLDAATTERTVLLAEIYRRGPVWRLRAVGQGYDHGPDVLARGYGGDIAG